MLPTVSIDTENGPVRINQSDYDPAAHKLTDPQPDWSALLNSAVPAAPAAPVAPPAPPAPPSGEPLPPMPAQEPPAQPAPPAPPAPADDDRFVTKLVDAWFITDAKGNKISDMNGENGEGYSTKKAAEAANK